MQVTYLQINRNQMEMTQHGTFSFPVAVYYSVMARNVLGYTNWHWHEELQFCRVTVGSIRFYVNGTQYLLHEGEGIFVNSGYLHMAKPEGRLDSTYICLDVSPKMLECFPGSVFEEKYVQPYLKTPTLENVFLRREVPWQNFLLESISEIYTLSEQAAFGYEIEIACTLNHMWLTMLKNRPGSADSRAYIRFQNNSAVRAILDYLRAHYGERITVEMVAQEACFSTGECCRMFKRVTGETIFSYLQSYRLTKASEYLRDTNLPISQIAYETGFCSTSYFIKVFKEKMGTTPFQYRKIV